jgi:hypothetical protein
MLKIRINEDDYDIEVIILTDNSFLDPYSLCLI